jgi:parallel beta-helix repeat protein
MEKAKRKKLVILVLSLAALVAISPMAKAAGSLEPNAPPGPVMKSLDEVEPRIPIKASDLPLTITQRGSYYLTQDVNFTSTTQNAVIVGCNDVTIDLAGFTVMGPNSGSYSGIYMNNRTNVEIRNGTVRDFYYGIRENSIYGSSCRVIAVRAISNQGSGMYIYGSGNLIKNCTAAENTINGIYVGAGSTVTGNTAYNNGNTGIYTDIGCTVTGNTAYSNGSYGFNVGSSSAIIGNTARDNGSYGIRTPSYSLVDQNAAFGNTTNLSTGTGCVLGTNCAP